MIIIPLPERAKMIKIQRAECSACGEEQNYIQDFGEET
jgi:ribosomal protein S14